ncbi:ankyrin repeat domain family member sosondowah isoform X2 [Dermatophagoides farinae]|uniref:ankyrin repeat domain family member sosondowah isoform X2 n=2 Tax=Dermatophagoides farinae TaxID=6954 RepID=UPI003F6260B8
MPKMDIEFTLNDILGYFEQKGGKVIYTELVTHFKAALSNPNTLANARVIFKNYVNTLATVINEDGMKYLILRPKYMKTLSRENLAPNSISSSSSVSSSSSSSPPTSPLQPKAITTLTTNYRHSNEYGTSNNGNGLKHSNDLNHLNLNVDNVSMSSSNNSKPNRPSSLLIINDLNDLNLSPSACNNNSIQQNEDKTNVINNPQHMLANNFVYNADLKQKQLPYYSNHNRTARYSSLMNNGASNGSVKNVLPTINEININNNNINSTKTSSSIVNNNCNENDNDPLLLTATVADDSPPPRPPPRKKNSFSQPAISPSSTSNVLVASSVGSTSASNNDPILRNNAHLHHHNHRLKQSNDALIETIETVNTVKKEIQELSRTPGRVKEHAQILNKLVQDTKLPMPTTTTNSISQVVNNKIRYNPSSQQSDTDSGSVHLTDPLKKRWIIASSDCDYQELVSLLKQDPELCRYCDCIMGYSALHWAAKFNKPEIIKLMAGTFKADPNVKSFSGSTPLHIAAQFKNEDIMKMLIYHYDANPDIRDNYGKKAHQYLPKKTNEFNVQGQSLSNRQLSDVSNNSPVIICNTGGSAANTTALSATENLKNNLRNKISHQSMLVRNTLRNTKAFKRRKSMNEKSKQKHLHKQQNAAAGNTHS